MGRASEVLDGMEKTIQTFHIAFAIHGGLRGIRAVDTTIWLKIRHNPWLHSTKRDEKHEGGRRLRPERENVRQHIGDSI
jgi:hypothetical protein